MIELTIEQRTFLHQFLCKTLTPDSLPMIVRLRLGQRLDQIVDLSKPFNNIVLALLEFYEQSGELEALLRAVLMALPSRTDLNDFCRNHFPAVLDPAISSGLIRSIGNAVSAIIDCLKDPQVRLTVGGFQADFRWLESQIRDLAQYKQLHEILHVLQKQLPVMLDAAKRFPEDVPAVKQLSPARLALDEQCRIAQNQAKGLPTEQIEMDWIDDLLASTQAIQDAWLKRDKEKMKSALSGLRILIQELPRIDGRLAVVMGQVQLQKLVEAIREIANKMKVHETHSRSTLPLEEGLRSLCLIRPTLSALVNQHNEWQWLDKELAGIESNPGPRPKDRVPRWDRVKQRLQGMCGAFAGDKWADAIRGFITSWEDLSNDWEKASSSESQVDHGRLQSVADACEIEADSLRAYGMNRFFDVDAELRILSEELVQIGTPLKTLLEAYTYA